ncbi:Os04g0152500 [Oryza sativa Japonica Group]|uniref:Os04g0152500 protein n=1 Tax=Oryza sativa subsp. japonica TaxID=39947 RepID=C7J162_ORYSJ|nr:Os04g0152500 [Oryza sativa Japonica Group]|eukprot:NP_001173753.1 Os04g0152500 [Oryza sativa Japonica Group]
MTEVAGATSTRRHATDGGAEAVSSGEMGAVAEGRGGGGGGAGGWG